MSSSKPALNVWTEINNRYIFVKVTLGKMNKIKTDSFVWMRNNKPLKSIENRRDKIVFPTVKLVLRIFIDEIGRFYFD